MVAELLCANPGRCRGIASYALSFEAYDAIPSNQPWAAGTDVIYLPSFIPTKLTIASSSTQGWADLADMGQITRILSGSALYQGGSPPVLTWRAP